VSTILDKIVETKRAEVADAKSRRPHAELQAAVRDTPDARDFYGTIAAPPKHGIHLIAEIKKKSPSAGLIRPDFDPTTIAQTYHASGASCISVLTDKPYFAGQLEYIEQVKSAVPLPVLRKDFIIDAYQLYQSRAAGADCVLLIGEVLPPSILSELLDLAYELGMTSLIEVHEPQTLADLQTAIGFPNNKRSLLGINNRNLKIQQTDLTTTETLATQIGEGTLLVSESGIQTREDVKRLIKANARALLIGETFMKSPDIGAKIKELLGA